MTFEEYWSKHWAAACTETADRTFGEEVWNASQRAAWEAVFQVVSDKAHLADREFIKALEVARGDAGVGP